MRFGSSGFVNPKVIYNARLDASLDKLNREDQIFMHKIATHSFKNIEDVEASALALIELIKDYKAETIYLGDPNIHFWLGSYFNRKFKSKYPINPLTIYLKVLDRNNFEPHFMLVTRPLIDQYKSFLKMFYLDNKAVKKTNKKDGESANFLLSDEENMFRERFKDMERRIIGFSPLFAMHSLSKMQGVNLAIDIFDFNWIREDSGRFLESIASKYSIEQFHNQTAAPSIVNKSMQYRNKDAELIDRIAERVINAKNLPPVGSLSKDIDQTLTSLLSSTKKFSPVKVTTDQFIKHN